MKFIKPTVHSFLCISRASKVFRIEDFEAWVHVWHYFLKKEPLFDFAFFYGALLGRTDHGNPCHFFNEVANAIDYGFFWADDAEVYVIFVCFCEFADFLYVQVGNDNVLCGGFKIEWVSLLVCYVVFS